MAIAQFNCGRIAEIAGAVVAEDVGLGPGFGIVFADADVVAAWCAAVAIAHEQAAIFEAEEMTRETPDADRVWDGPGLAPIGGF